MSPPSTPTSSSFVSLTSLLGTSPAETSLRNFQNGIAAPPSPAPSHSATRTARPTSSRPFAELLGVSPLVMTWDVPSSGAAGRGAVDVDGKSIPLEQQRHLSFSDTILSLLQEAETAHRATSPTIVLNLEEHPRREEYLYRGNEEYTIQGRDEASNEPALLYLRADYKFGPWSHADGSGDGPKTSRGTRPRQLKFTPKHPIDRVLPMRTTYELETTDVTVGSECAWHLIEPMDRAHQVLKCKATAGKTDAEEVAKRYGTAPTVLLTLTFRRPHGCFPTLSGPARGQEQ